MPLLYPCKQDYLILRQLLLFVYSNTVAASALLYALTLHARHFLEHFVGKKYRYTNPIIGF